MKTKLSVIVFCMLALAGCGNRDLYSGDVYTAQQAKTVRSVTYGTLIAIRPVLVQTNTNSRGMYGQLGGGALGGVIGSSVGSGSGRAIAIATGAILGIMLGEQAENKLSQAEAAELEIKKDDGSIIVVVQTITDTKFVTGQRVRLVGSGNSLNVSPL